ncbi:MAG: hypothetical protein DME22_10205 [Verrucomicrobia bacterium]|nr:MAG: hypothetical protein DME22_10205 [Verrucomicrobiota bacterium]
MVGAYSFNEGAGTSVGDGSGNGNVGTISGASWTSAGKYGNGLSFNGTSALVTVNDSGSLHLTTGMTLEAWVNATTVSSAWRDVIYKGRDNYFLEGTSDNNKLPGGGATLGGAGALTYGTGALGVGTWTHLALTYDGAALRLYVNGTQVSSVAKTGTILTSTNPLQIGGDSMYGQYFAGTIDEVRVYNVALSAAQIQGDMNTPIGGSNPNTAPTISAIADQVTNEDTSAGPINFTVGDVETGAGSLTVSGSSSDVTVVPNGNIAFGGSGANRTVTVMPAANQNGTATITVTVSDGALTGSSRFALTVNAVNDAPTISGIANQTTTVNTAAGPINFTVGDVETGAGSLTVSGSSSDVTLVPNGNIVFGGSGANRTVTVTPAGGQTGTATITVAVSDGQLSSNTWFTLTVNASGPPATGLVGAYSFNEGAGTSVGDGSGNGNVGTISGASWTSAGKYGSGLVFNGSGARVTINDSGSLHLTTGMTLEAWVNATTVSSAWRDVIYKGNDNYFLEGTSDNNKLPGGGATLGGAGALTYGTGALAVGTWTHLALTYDGAALRLYVNGTQVSSVAKTGTILTSTNPLQIGGDSMYGQYFAGTIDEVRVYNVALSAAQIQADMNTPIP